MRISLLLRREPFVEILQRTLARYWASKHNDDFRVQWISRGQGVSRQTEQQWLCNQYLNAIFLPSIDPTGLEPIRKEFSHSQSVWRRPIQRLYVSMATGTWSRRLSHATLNVSPEVPDGEQKVIVPGNQKVRILDHVAGQCVSIAKDGFDPIGLCAEMEVRELAKELELPVPSLLGGQAADGWFREKYVSGTPLNRLPDARQVAEIQRRAIAAVKKLIRVTASEQPIDEYARGLTKHTLKMLDQNNRMNPDIQEFVRAGVHHLRNRICRNEKGTVPLLVARTHGDFQPANILVNGGQFWLIDWEHSATRQSGYDLFVLRLNSRLSTGVAGRLQQLVISGTSLAGDEEWPGLQWETLANRQRHADIFLLEELAWHINENRNQLFLRQSDGLTQIINELKVWLAMTP